MPEIIYRYFPRFHTGLFIVTKKPNGGLKYRFITGQVIYPSAPNQFIAEVEFLNVFGLVFAPNIIATLRK